MTSLMILFLTTTSLILESPILVLGGLCVVGFCLTSPDRADAKSSDLSRHTLVDIGIEPGSITWMR